MQVIPDILQEPGSFLSGLQSAALADCKITACDSTSNSPDDLSKSIPLLVVAMESEKTYPEDVFQAQISLAWLHWTLNESDIALSRLPKQLAEAFHRLTTKDGGTANGWTHVCVAKGAYIYGSCCNRIIFPYAGNVKDS